MKETAIPGSPFPFIKRGFINFGSVLGNCRKLLTLTAKDGKFPQMPQSFAVQLGTSVK